MNIAFTAELNQLEETIDSLANEIAIAKAAKKQIQQKQRLLDSTIEKVRATVEKIAGDGKAIEYLREGLKGLALFGTGNANIIFSEGTFNDNLSTGVNNLTANEGSFTKNKNFPRNEILQRPVYKQETEEEFKSRMEAVKTQKPITRTAEQVARFEEDIARLGGYKVEETLIDRPEKENKSNDFYTWQPTSNSAVYNYFNVRRGVNQATYVGANNKARLKWLESKLLNLELENIAIVLRKAQRTNFKYELKIKGLDDDLIGWLTQFNFSSDLPSQFTSKVEKTPQEFWHGQCCDRWCEIETTVPDPDPTDEGKELKFIANSFGKNVLEVQLDKMLHAQSEKTDEDTAEILDTPRNSEAREKELIRFQDCFGKSVLEVGLDNLMYAVVSSESLRDDGLKYYQILEDRIQQGFINCRNLDTGEVFQRRATNFKFCDLPEKYCFWLHKDFTRYDRSTEEMGIFYRWAMLDCNSKQELEALKKDPNSCVETMKWVYNDLPPGEKEQIDRLCKKLKKVEESNKVA
ncbi:MAG: hypothetical protein QNJ38_01465 [Prochloraceae cyanobacterium]|nr:hypothetical protein [Prochloraceae cyanobacterium]